MNRISHFAAPIAMGAALFLGAQGCTHERADEIPASASELATGTETVTAAAPHDGMFYIWDQTANKMLYEGRAERGDTVKVDAKHNRILLNDHVITKRDDLINDHHFKIFFDQKDLDRERDRALRSGATITPMTAQPQQQPQVQVQVQQPQPQPQAQPAPAPAPAPGATVYTPSPSNPNTTVVVPDSKNNTSGTTVVVPPPAPAK